MLPKAFLLGGLTALSFLCLGQAKDSTAKNSFNSNTRRAYLGISYGFSLPMGSFSINGENLENSAFANDGTNFHLFDFGYLISESFSVKSFYLSAKNELNENKLAEAINKTHNKQVSIQASSYELKALMIGLGITKVKPVVDFDLHFLLGYGQSFLPAITVSERDTATLDIKNTLFNPSSDYGFGVGLSTALRVHLNKVIDFTTQLSYTVFEKEFEQLRIENNTTQLTQSKIGYEILSVNFGLAYRFNFEKPKVTPN